MTGEAYLVGAISDDKPVDGAPHGGIHHHLRQQGLLLPRRRGPLLRRRRRDARGRLGAHRGARHPAPPAERGRRERGRGWGGGGEAAAGAEVDLLVVRDARGGHGHGVRGGNRFQGGRPVAPAIYYYAVVLRLRASRRRRLEEMGMDSSCS